MRLFILAALGACAAAGARPEPALSGTLLGGSFNRIVAAGNLIVRGRKSNAIRYTVTGGSARFEAGSGQLIFPEAASVRVEVPRASRFLSLTSASGFLDVADLDGSVLAAAPAGKITLDRIGGDVEVHSAGGSTVLGTIGGFVRCYSLGGNIRAVRVKGAALFETGGGDIQLGDVVGLVRALTGAGGIRIEEARSQVTAETVGGPITVLRALGPVIATSDGGPIEIGAASSVQCRSTGGTIRLNNISGALEAATERGSIVAEILPGRKLGASLLSTGAGDITVFVPSDTGVSIEAQAAGTLDIRSIVSDFPGLRIARSGAAVVARGRINGGGPVLRLEGARGRIEIRRK